MNDRFEHQQRAARGASRRLAKMSHLQGKRLLDVCTREFDIVCAALLDKFQHTCTETIDEMHDKLGGLEHQVANVLSANEAVVADIEQTCVEQVDFHRGEKKILVQWCNGFLLTPATERDFTPVDFAFMRFALNMAYAADLTPVDRMLSARVPSFLVNMLHSSNQAVTGPATLALVHLSLHPEARIPICDAGAIPAITKNLKENPSAATNCQMCKLAASLVIEGANKYRLAGTRSQPEGLAALVHLISEASEFMDQPRCSNDTRAAALMALVNLTYKADQNRQLLVDEGGIKPIIETAITNPDSHCMEQAVRLLANVAFNDPIASAGMLRQQGIEAFCESIKVADLRTDHLVLESAFTGIANLCNNELNQNQVGATEAIEICISVCRVAPNPRVLWSAANALAAIAFRSLVNKLRFAELGAVQSLLLLIETHGFGDHYYIADYQPAVAAACRALASLLLHRTNLFIIRDILGLKTLVQLALTTEDTEVLDCVAMPIASNVPPAEDRFDAHDEGRPIQVEEYRAVDGLNRSKKHILDRGVKVPDWLNEAIKVLAMDDRQLIRAKKRAMQKGERVDRIPAEYVIRTSHFFERYTDVEPDHVVKTSKDLERLIYKVY